MANMMVMSMMCVVFILILFLPRPALMTFNQTLKGCATKVRMWPKAAWANAYGARSAHAGMHFAKATEA